MRNINNYISELNELFNSLEFLEKLCGLSKNNPNKVVENIAKLINDYMLNGKLADDLEIVFERDFEDNDKTFFTPSNTKFKKKFSLCGGKNSLTSEMKANMEELAKDMGIILNAGPIEASIEIEYAVYRAMKIVPYYNLFFENVKATEYIVSEDARDYYRRVVRNKQKRMGQPQKESTIELLDSLLKEFEGERPCLYVSRYPHFFKSNAIVLPDIFQIINICAKNMSLKDGDKIDPNDGLPIDQEKVNYYRTINNQEKSMDFRYTRYELVTIDENFRYFHENLTGDAKIDLKTLYGKNDVHDNQSVYKRHYLENIASIKDKNDILLKLNDGVYSISNGRHRIVYMKFFYDSNSSYFEDEELERFKKLFTIPIKVSHKIENREFNELLAQLKKVKVIKNNILDDEANVGIIIDNSLYFVNGVDELRELVFELEKGNRDNKYLFVMYSILKKVDYNDILYIIYNRIGDRLFKISFRELLELLPREIMVVINPYLLYEHYTMVINNHLRNNYFSLPGPLIPNTIYSDSTIIDRIVEVLSSNPELLKLSEEEIIERIKAIDEFSSISDIELKIIIDKYGINSDNNEMKKKEL